MLLSDGEAASLKGWVVKRLEDISDADPDILADYAIALVRADAPEASLKQNTLEQLKDFLGPIAERFVTELFEEINARAHVQNATQSITKPAPAVLQPRSMLQNPCSVTDNIHPSRSGHISIGPADHDLKTSSQSKKRSWQDAQDPNEMREIPTGPKRQMKQSRKPGVRGTSHVAGNSGSFNQLHPLLYSGAGIPGGLPQFGDFSQLDANSALHAMMALQAQIFALPGPNLPGSASLPDSRPKCQDYFHRGRCDRGIACPFGHGSDSITMPSEEYDPNNPSAPSASVPTAMLASQSGMNQARGTFRGAKNNRAPFSVPGPDFSQTNQNIVIEQIPEENFDEDQVRDFFQKFGPIQDVNMQPYKRLAIVKFADHDSAQAAWGSPKVVFNNRFVKVYWYDPNTVPQPSVVTANGKPNTAAPKPEFDREKFEEQNAEAQKRYESRLKAKEEAADQSREIQAKCAALVEEHKLLKEKLRERGIEVTTELQLGDTDNNSDTDALKAQLAALEEEARGMGIDPDAMDDDSSEYTSSYASRGRDGHRGFYNGRSYYRGRGGYRGRSTPWPTRGTPRATRGRGAAGGPYRGAIQAGGRYNLDLRPRRVKVVLQDDDASWDETKDECLKEHLFGLGEFESVESSSEDDDTESSKAAVVVFKDRATAEMLFYGNRYIKALGKVEFAWIANPPTPPQASTTIDLDHENDDDVDGDDTIMINAPADRTNGLSNGRPGHRGLDDDDYDVAEEDERWVVT